MNVMRVLIGVVMCAALGLAAWGENVTAKAFVASATPAARELSAPRGVLAYAGGTRLAVLDAGLHRVSIFTPDGAFVKTCPLPDGALGETPPAVPLLPQPVLAAVKDSLCLLTLDRDDRTLTVTPLDPTGEARVVTLSERAAGAAVTLDPAGRVLAASLQLENGKLALVLEREDADGTLAVLKTLENPCDGQWKLLHLTGLAAGADGRVAVGVAQAGDPNFRFLKSWLFEATLKDGKVAGELRVAQRAALLDGRGKVQDRYRALAGLAGRQGYPDKACVPLFTALALGPDGLLVTGGHAVDPFLRVYDDRQLLCSLPRRVGGGQTAAVAEAPTPRLFALDLTAGRVDELTLDGRVAASVGRPAPVNLAEPLALAADRKGLYAALRRGTELCLARYATDGRLLWSRELIPPPSLERAEPVLTAPNAEQVLVGWRQPGAVGLGFVQTVMSDGLPGLPLWPLPFAGKKAEGDPGPTPMLTGENGRVYVVRELETGPQVLAVSLTGAVVQKFDPKKIAGLTAVDAAGNLAWARREGDSLVIARYTFQGVYAGMKRIPRHTEQATLHMAGAGWGWLSTTDTLLRFDPTMTVTDELTILDPDGKRVTQPLALANDGQDRIYLALPNRLLVIDNAGKAAE